MFASACACVCVCVCVCVCAHELVYVCAVVCVVCVCVRVCVCGSGSGGTGVMLNCRQVPTAWWILHCETLAERAPEPGRILYNVCCRCCRPPPSDTVLAYRPELHPAQVQRAMNTSLQCKEAD